MQVIILRGLPGCGKTTWHTQHHPGAWACSADDFFVVDGVYRYDRSKIAEAHSACLRRFVAGLARKEPIVIVDNVHVRTWEYAHYVDVASLAGYSAEIRAWSPPPSTREGEEVLRNFAQRNIHGVPLGAIAAMRYAWQFGTPFIDGKIMIPIEMSPQWETLYKVSAHRR